MTNGEEKTEERKKATVSRIAPEVSIEDIPIQGRGFIPDHIRETEDN